VRIRASLVRDSDGIPQFSVLHVEDITERRRTAEALRESEDRFRIMADCSPTMMWVTDADGGCQFVNQAYREFFGTTYEQVAGDKWQGLLHPDDASEYIGAFHSAVREHASFQAEARVRRADGEWRLLGSHAEPRLSPQGEYLGHVGLSADITERRQAEQAIRDSREFAQSTIDALSSHICVLDEAGRIIAVNRAWKQFAEANHKVGAEFLNTGGDGGFGEGANYLTVCDHSIGADASEAFEVAAGIRAVLEGKRS
jgi:two-component system NtrC family sensor kinase